MIEIYDVSMPIHPEMPVYKNKPEKKPEFAQSYNPDSDVRETRLQIDAHTGTHIDAPLHMLPEGSTIEAYPLADMITSCKVLDLTRVSDRISGADLEQQEINKGDFVLLKTRNSFQDEFDFNFIYLDATGALHLAEKEIRGVGIDALGIERAQPQHQTHKTLFRAGITIIEGLRLAEVPPGNYTLIATPLPLVKVEASPVRALLVANSDLAKIVEGM